MVDLVKIRKKAKKGDAEAPKETTPEVVVEHASAPAPVAPKPVQPAAIESPAVVISADHRASDKLERFKAEAGKKREGFVAQSVSSETKDGEMLELLTFTISGEHYAVPIEEIVEIVTPRSVTRIPNAEESIVGIISLRGTIVTLLDVRARLKHPPKVQTADTRIIVVDHRSETLGFEVDRVSRVVKLDAGEVEPHPVVHASELTESIRGVFRQANALTILLDLEKLLDGRRPAAIVRTQGAAENAGAHA